MNFNKAQVNPWLAMAEDQQVPLMLQNMGVGMPEAVSRDPASLGASQVQTYQASPGIVPQDKYDSLMNRLEARSLQGIKDQRSSIEKLREYQADLGKQEAQFDLSPLMALADQWTGSNLSQGYKRPETAAEKKARAMQIEQTIAGQNSKITDDELGLLKTQMMGEMYKNKADLAAQGGGISDLSGEAKKMLGLANEGINAVNGMTAALDSGVGPSRIDSNTPLLGTFVSDNAFTSNQRIAAEMFGRLQSGGAINKEEENRFIAMGPRPGDDPQQARLKLAAQKAALEDRMKIVGGSPESLAAIGVTPRNSIPSAATKSAPRILSREEWKAARSKQ